MVPSGVVRILHYETRRPGGPGSAWVYTPPNYHRRTAFPVVYLVPSPGNASFLWTFIDSANETINRLTVHDAVRPTIVVIPIVQNRQPIDQGGQSPRSTGAASEEKCATEVFLDLLPLIERSFNISADPRDRAIVAVSTYRATGRFASLRCRVLTQAAATTDLDGEDKAFFLALISGNELLSAERRLRMVCLSLQDAGTASSAGDPEISSSPRSVGGGIPTAGETGRGGLVGLSDVVRVAMTAVSRTPTWAIGGRMSPAAP